MYDWRRVLFLKTCYYRLWSQVSLQESALWPKTRRCFAVIPDSNNTHLAIGVRSREVTVESGTFNEPSNNIRRMLVTVPELKSRSTVKASFTCIIYEYLIIQVVCLSVMTDHRT